MKKANITVHLEEDFDQWDRRKERWLIERLSELAGCSVEEVQVRGRKKACVLLFLELPEEAAARLESEFKSGLNPGEYTRQSVKDIVKEILDEFDDVSIRADLVRRSNYVATTPKPQPPLFVLIHGWTGSRDSFGKLPAILEEEYNCEVEIPEYKSSFRTGGDPLLILGGQLSTTINNRTFQSPRQVVLIGHSMGGVVLRTSLVESLRDKHRHYARNVELIVNVASPLGGTWLGGLANYIPGKFSVMKQAAELSMNSPTLAETTKWWHHWVSENKHLEGRIRSIYSADDQVVPINSAIGQDPNAICISGTGHSDIVKPQDRADEISLTILRLATVAGIRRFDMAAKTSDGENAHPAEVRARTF
ncbi:hypothetical protein NHU_00833 [Rhodovulum sulfidophilum]|uniref:GPI inositol-deacylase PGAP1-like alpha/beta domain-containing protein n=1 Tax=Rhodovulum sulfidophilum TaxID=35806 RepID=A0A0D6AZ13_RHOSU|nr:hypothetical protein NHU_00833 [Rhodovulum sulfidophilum]